MQAKRTRRQTRQWPDHFDIHVAMRLRQRRIELGLTQPELAAKLGVMFQSLYKYEHAINRITAGQLYRLSKVLDVPVTFFFEGIESGLTAQSRSRPPKAGR